MLEIKTIPFFVIHLESAKERIPNLLKLKETFGENLSFWKAMTSGDFFLKEPDFPIIYEFQREVGAEVKKLILKPGELGCLISHLSILTYMIEKNLDVIGILEDDMELTSDFSALEAFYTINKGRSWDILVLGSNEWVDITKQDEVSVEITRFWGTHALIITRKAAEAIIETYVDLLQKSLAYPADWHYAKSISSKGLIVYGPKDCKSLCRQKPGFVSAINGSVRQ